MNGYSLFYIILINIFLFLSTIYLCFNKSSLLDSFGDPSDFPFTDESGNIVSTNDGGIVVSDKIGNIDVLNIDQIQKYFNGAPTNM